MAFPGSISIKQLHAKTGECVRQAGAAKTPVPVTDRGKLVAVLAAPSLLPGTRKKRTLLPEYATLLKKPAGREVIAALDAIRGNR